MSENSCAALQPAVAARFCPKLFELGASRAEGSPFDLPYRMVFAVATVETVIIYDTTEQQPLAVLGGLHFEAAPITDIAWSCDGRYLAISSYDGGRSAKDHARQQELLTRHSFQVTKLTVSDNSPWMCRQSAITVSCSPSHPAWGR